MPKAVCCGTMADLAPEMTSTNRSSFVVVRNEPRLHARPFYRRPQVRRFLAPYAASIAVINAAIVAAGGVPPRW